jgi:hypothetical protein
MNDALLESLKTTIGVWSARTTVRNLPANIMERLDAPISTRRAVPSPQLMRAKPGSIAEPAYISKPLGEYANKGKWRDE